jgi:hypothetical protein
MSGDSAARKLNPQQVGRVGEHYVAAELHRRGAYAVTFSGNMPDIDILASDVQRTRTVSIQVKTKTAGTWHTSIRRGRPREEEPDEAEFWIFVDIGKDPEARPAFFIVPAWWIENSIHQEHEAYLGRHGGKRARSPESTHHAIAAPRLEAWRERWDLLGIFSDRTHRRRPATRRPT